MLIGVNKNCRLLEFMDALTEASHAGGVDSHARRTVTAERAKSVDADTASLTYVRKHRTLVHIYTSS